MRARTTTVSRLSLLTAATLLALAGTPTLALPVIGDFNNDANVDILWQHRYGLILYWACDGNPLNQHFVMGAASLNPTPGPNLRLVGRGDFDADSFTDLLFSNTLTGETVVVTRPGEGNAQQHALPAAPRATGASSRSPTSTTTPGPTFSGASRAKAAPLSGSSRTSPSRKPSTFRWSRSVPGTPSARATSPTTARPTSSGATTGTASAPSGR